MDNQKMYTLQDIAVRWNCSAEKVSRMFANRKGVVDIGTRPDTRKRKRGYAMLRIPPAVLAEVERERTR